ncbi:MAG: phospholipase [Planctomycetota bacterium]|nr:MAG: phospholipase [Planctomycetota bacterium]REJ95839.1 MAG: phospholipase [Planctomycetota bacterium]REK25548.1 MAG: phospholipase [Planctomycetota bacterium]REK31740.1 MAG: phospholipase [Planctomycetota bacterium]
MYQIETTTRGGLECNIVDREGARESPAVVAVFCHGFGAPGEDLVPVVGELGRHLGASADRVRFVFPAAPLRLDSEGIPGGRAWWPLDMARMQAAIEGGEFRDLRKDCPPQLADARRMLNELLSEIREETGLPMSRFVIGGFSQGSMLATDVALRADEAPGGVVVWSGTLLCEDEWRDAAPRRSGLPVVQSHGRSDPLLPFEAAEWLRDVLTGAGLEVQFLPFAGMHQIPAEALQAASRLIERVLDRDD